ncbi:MAG: hypothetical protein G01um101419_587 [Parcubacteria group bacterium Gr01-1014_19]|nr:MAG: hypothetical protein G01um101419_587 [Parcubacteria group bacterium Gr01-1014_19]
MPQTEIVPISQEVLDSPAMKKRVELRTMSAESFIEGHASGTLRKNKRLQFAWKSQYWEERIAYEFGWGFRSAPYSQVTYNDPITCGDDKSVTEAGWHIERYLNMSVFPEDYFEAKYIMVEDRDGHRHEGIGIIVRQTSAAWIPRGHLIFAIVAKFRPDTGHYEHAENPF